MLLRPSSRTLPGNNKTQAQRNELHRGLDRQKTQLSPENSNRMHSVIDDPNYIYYNASGVGTYLELWVCVNILCPGCGNKLYK